MANARDLSPDQRGGLVRGVLRAPPGYELAVCDFSGIEARVLAWLAGDADQLALFRSGGCPYKAAASTIFGVPASEISKEDPRRQIGKTAELALGYGMGWRKFEANAGREKLQAAGTTASRVVTLWRKQRQPVVQYWAALERAWRTADAPFALYDDGTLRCELPSGRELVYRDADAEGYVGKGNRYQRVYGGLLAENIVQAASRDLLADSLVRAEAAGLRPVMHVHDEIVCEVPAAQAAAALEQLRKIMHESTAPSWAAGCPITSEGYHAVRYRK